MTPTSSQIPKCRLCGRPHFARENCAGQLHGTTKTTQRALAVKPAATAAKPPGQAKKNGKRK